MGVEPERRSQTPGADGSRKRTQLLVGLAIACLAFAVSANTLSGGFVYDDHDNVLRNPWVREPGRLGEAFTRHMAGFSPAYDTSYYRPLMHVLLAGAHGLFGVDPWGYHLALAILHAATCVAVFALLARFTAGRGGEPVEAGSLQGALVGALLFAVHPIHTEVVAWISGVVDLSYSLLVVLTLLALTSASPWRRLFLAPALFFLSLLGKEPAVMVVPLFATLAFARGDLEDPRTRRRFWAACAGLGLALALYLVLRLAALGGLMGTGGARRVAVSAGEGLLTAFALFGEYARLLLLPWNQSALHDFRVASGPMDPRPWAGVVVAIAVGALAWRLRRNAGAVLGLALLVFPLLPALYVPVLGEGLVGERYLYLPSVGLALLAALAWNAWRERAPARTWPGLALAAVLVAVGATASFSRNRVWHDDLALWTDAARKAPRSAAAHEHLGFALLVGGRPSEAVSSLSRAIEIDPMRRDARTNLASALAALGRSDEAIVQIQGVLAESPRNAEAHAILGSAFASQGKLTDAVAEYRRALEIDPRVASFHNGLAIALALLGDVRSAEEHFREAMRLDPRAPEYGNNLIILQRRAATAPPEPERP